MSKTDRFLMLVNLFCISHVRTGWPSFDNLGAVGIMSAAMRIPDEIIPDDYISAVSEFCEHVTHLDYSDMKRPEWLSVDVIDYRRWRKS